MGDMGIFKRLKLIIPDMYDSNLNKRVEVIGAVKNRKLPKKFIDEIYLFIDFVMNYGVVAEVTIEYIKDKKITVRELCSTIFKRENEDEYLSVKNKISYDQRKIESTFGRRVLEDMLDGRAEALRYIDLIESEKSKIILKGSVDDRLLLTIRKDVIRDSYDGDFVSDYFDVLSGYSRVRKENTEKELYEDKDFCGYYNYIVSDIGDKSEEAKADLERLNKVLNGEADSRLVDSESKTSDENTIESIAVNDSLGMAISELGSRVCTIEENKVYRRKDRAKHIESLVRSGKVDVKRYNGKFAGVNNKIVITTIEIDEDKSIEELNIGRLIDIELEQINGINIQRIIGEAKRVSLVENIEYEKMAVSILGTNIRISDIEQVYKSIASEDKRYTVEANARFIRIHSKYGVGIVTNSNEDRNLRLIE